MSDPPLIPRFLTREQEQTTLQVLDKEALGKLLGYHPATIKRLASQQPETLPPRIEGLSKLLWYAPAVDAWLRQKSAPAARKGRPRKA